MDALQTALAKQAESKVARLNLEREGARRDTVSAAWGRLYERCPDELPEVKYQQWLKGYARRIAEFGCSVADYADNVSALASDDTTTQLAYDLLKVGLLAKIQPVLELLQKYPRPKDACGWWYLKFNRDIPLEVFTGSKPQPQTFDSSGSYFHFLREHRSLTDAQIRDHWQGLSDAARREMCPKDYERIISNKQSADALTRIVKERRYRSTKKSAHARA